MWKSIISKYKCWRVSEGWKIKKYIVILALIFYDVFQYICENEYCSYYLIKMDYFLFR